MSVQEYTNCTHHRQELFLWVIQSAFYLINMAMKPWNFERRGLISDAFVVQRVINNK